MSFCSSFHIQNNTYTEYNKILFLIASTHSNVSAGFLNCDDDDEDNATGNCIHFQEIGGEKN
jgi:hypothetical protein